MRSLRIPEFYSGSIKETIDELVSEGRTATGCIVITVDGPMGSADAMFAEEILKTQEDSECCTRTK
jgi:hypothetical protein